MSRSLVAFVIFGAVVGLMMPGGRSSRSAAPEATSTTYSAVPVETRVRRSQGGHFYPSRSSREIAFLLSFYPREKARLPLA